MSIKFKTYPLDGICKLQMGKTPKRENAEYWGEGFPWVSIADMKGKFIEATKEQITAKAVEESGCKLIRKGTLLLSFKLSIGKLGFAATDLFTNEAIVALQIRDYYEVYPEYLYYVLKTLPLAGRNIAAKGSTLNTASLKKIPVPIPDKYEDQIRIASVLAKIETLISERKESIKQLDTFLKSTFIDLFGNPQINEKKWKLKALEDITEKITDGKHGDCVNEEKSGYYFISAKDLVNGKIEYKGVREITKVDFEETHKRTRLKLNDILIGNTGASIGKIAIVTDEEKASRTTFQKSVAILTVKDEFLTAKFFKAYLETQRDFLEKVSSGSGQKNLLLSQIRNLKIIIPPIKLQTYFVNVVERADVVKEIYSTSLAQFANLFASVNNRVFKGQLDLSKLDVTAEMQSLFELVESAPPVEAEEKRRPRTTKVDKLTLANYYEDDFALLIKKHFANFHFKFSDIEEMFSEEEGGVITYHTTQELKQMKEKAPKDIQTFIFDCVEKKNKNLKLNQIFYNALTDLNLKKIKLKAGNETVMQQINDKQISIEDLSGIYFQIAK